MEEEGSERRVEWRKRGVEEEWSEGEEEEEEKNEGEDEEAPFQHPV